MQQLDETHGRQAPPSVLIVLLNWNAHAETQAAIASALRLDYPSFTILIVDNGSTDHSVSYLRKMAGDRIQLLESSTNLGYTGGCNLGLARALELGVAYTWLLNNDALVEPRTLSSLVRLAESDDRIGLATPMIGTLDEPPRLTFAGGVIQMHPPRYDETHDPEEARRWETLYPGKDLVLGTAMLVRMSMVREIGALDSSLFAYFEDVDLCVRAIAAGWRNAVDPSSIVRHLEKNRNRDPRAMKPHYWYYVARNESRFWRKHLGPWRSLRKRWQSFNRYLRFFARCRDLPSSTDAILGGLWDGWLGRGGEYNPRRRMPTLPAALCRLYARCFTT